MMLPPRIITGVAYLFGWVLLAWLGGWWLTAAVAVAATMAVLELKWVASRRRVRLAPEVAYPIAIAFVAAAHRFANDLENYGLAVLALVVLLVLCDFGVHLRQGVRQATACVSLTVFASLYAGLMLSALVLIRGYLPDLTADTAFGPWPLGQRLLFFLLLVTMVSDTGAYLTGKVLGRRHLTDTVSPTKTVEGCVGGVVCAVLAALVAGHLFNVGVTPTDELTAAAAWRLSVGHRILMGLLLGAFGQIGDFGASIFKREAEVKDYGGAFPGHGGFVDRLDTLIINAPLLYLYVQLQL